MAEVWFAEGVRPLSLLVIGDPGSGEVDMGLVAFGDPGEVRYLLEVGPFEELKEGRRYVSLSVPTVFEAGRAKAGSCAVDPGKVVAVRALEWGKLAEAESLEQVLADLEEDG